jgi:cathepsin L
MKLIILLALVGIACANIFTQEEVHRNFEQFKLKYGRQYSSAVQEEIRREIFAYNLEKIHLHNLQADNGVKTFRLAVNNFTDMSNLEFRSYFNGLRFQRTVPKSPAEIFVETGKPMPKTVDWRDKGVVTGVKNQEQCGSCWAFSAVASLEGQHALKTKKLVSLSEQNLVDCSSKEGNFGCEGGLMDQAFQYVIDARGIDTENSYPYKAIDEKCDFSTKTIGATLKSYTDIPTGNEKALEEAVATVGPISVAIDASQMSFQFYSSGVYNEPECSSVQLDHGVTAVGYGTQSGQDYWLVKNSWGTDWGQKGYILMSRNKQNQCGIATASSYPNV